MRCPIRSTPTSKTSAARAPRSPTDETAKAGVGVGGWHTKGISYSAILVIIAFVSDLASGLLLVLHQTFVCPLFTFPFSLSDLKALASSYTLGWKSVIFAPSHWFSSSGRAGGLRGLGGRDRDSCLRHPANKHERRTSDRRRQDCGFTVDVEVIHPDPLDLAVGLCRG